MEITQLTEATEEALRDINTLLEQLRKDDPTSSPMSDLEAVIRDEQCTLFVVKDGEKIIGMASLYIIPKLGKINATVEDVVVDNAYRGQGIGAKLMNEVIAAAREKNVGSLYLTSRPAREAAHGLYKKVGFKVKDTVVFKMSL